MDISFTYLFDQV